MLTDSFFGDYGIEKADLNGDGRMDLVAFGWASGTLAWFENTEREWLEHPIGKYPGIVSLDFADVDKDNRMDIVVA